MAGGRAKSGGRLGAPAMPFTVPMRPPTTEEAEQIARVARAPRVGILRGLGILFGLGAILLAITWYFGFPYDPSTFVVEVVIVGILGAALGGAAAGIVRGPRAALARGETIDLVGPVEPFGARARGLSAVTVGPIALAMPSKVAALLPSGGPHRIVLALETRQLLIPNLGITTRALLLAVDQTPLPAPPPIYAVQVTPIYAAPASPAGLVLPASVPAAPNAPLPVPPPTSVAAHVFCPRCGYENPADTRFCPRCGNSVPVVAPTRPTPA
jgi:hypothetical protein